jgi:ubiquitin C-terminal hydrolase
MREKAVDGRFCGPVLSAHGKAFRFPRTYILQCEVKNKKNVEESLQLYIQEEILEGDNKYLCAQCDRKVDAAKRCVKPELLKSCPH